MKIQETYYAASILKGGFEFIDHSFDLTKEELKEIQQFGEYSTVFYLDNPSEVQIKNLYPTNKAWLRLRCSPEKIVLLNSVYTGNVNHTPNRPGNFFTHTIVIDKKNISDSFSKINVLRTYNFKERFSVDEDKIFEPKLSKNNSETEFQNLNTGSEEFNFHQFSNFLNKDSNLNIFISILDYVFTFKIFDQGQNISIISTKDQLEDWIFSIFYFLPKRMQELLPFATYVHTPDKYPFKITGLLEESKHQRLKSDYFKVFLTSKSVELVETNNYISVIKDIIIDKDYDKWVALKKEIEGLDYKRIERHLEKFIFIGNCHLETDISKFKEYFSSFSEIEFDKYFTLSASNQSVFKESIIYKLNQELENSRDKNENLNVFEKNLLYILNSDNLNSINDFVSSFLSKISRQDKLFFVTYILQHKNIDISGSEVLKDCLCELNNETVNFSSISIEKEEMLRIINEKYALNNDNCQNIIGFMKYKEILHNLDKSNILQNLVLQKADIQSLKTKDQISLLITAVNSSNLFLKEENLSFIEIKAVIIEILGDEQHTFWKTFFNSNKEYSKNLKKYTLEYLKKILVSEVFLKQSDTLILKEIEFKNDYDLKWIKEQIENSTNDENILLSFNKYVEVNNNIKRSIWGWQR